jgi:hypothetical protein
MRTRWRREAARARSRPAVAGLRLVRPVPNFEASAATAFRALVAGLPRAERRGGRHERLPRTDTSLLGSMVVDGRSLDAGACSLIMAALGVILIAGGVAAVAERIGWSFLPTSRKRQALLPLAHRRSCFDLAAVAEGTCAASRWWCSAAVSRFAATVATCS